MTTNWVSELSSGYDGYRCTECGTWVYHNEIRNCKCHPHFKLISAKTEKFYDLSDGSKVMSTTIEPSEPHGHWPGNETRIRQWKICEVGSPVYRECSHEEIERFESITTWAPFDIIYHKSLGPVTTPK